MPQLGIPRSRFLVLVASVALALCGCGGHGTGGDHSVGAEDGGTAFTGAFVPQVGGAYDAAAPAGPLDPVPCGTLGLGSVWATAFSPDGTSLAVAAERMRFFSTDDWHQVREFDDSPFRFSNQWQRLTFMAGGTLLVGVGYYPGQVAIWRVEDGTLFYTLSFAAGPNDGMWAARIATSAVGLLALTDGVSVVLWDVAEQRTAHAMAPTRGQVGHLALSDNGDILAIEELDAQEVDGGTQFATARISLWNAGNGRLLRTIATQGAEAEALAFSPGADVLLAVLKDPLSKCEGFNCDAYVDFRRISDGTLLRRAGPFKVSPTGPWEAQLDYAPAGDLVAVSLNDSSATVSIVRASDGALVNDFQNPYDGWISWSPNGQLAFVRGASVEIRDPLDGTITEVVADGPPFGVNTAAFSPDGELLAVAGGPGSYSGSGSASDFAVYLWRLADDVLISQFPGHQAAVRSLAFSPDGQTIASGGDDATLRLWSTTAGSPPVVLAQDRPLTAVSFSFDGALVASGDSAGTVLLRSAQDGTIVRTLQGQDTVEVAVFSNDGKWLATGGTNPPIVLWDVGMGQAIASASHGYSVVALAFSPDGSLLASAATAGPFVLGGDPNIQLWQVAGSSLVAQTAIAVGEGSQSVYYSVTGLAISPDGATLLAAGPNYQVQMYRLPGGDPIEGFAQAGFGEAFAVSRDASRIALGGFTTIDLWCRRP